MTLELLYLDAHALQQHACKEVVDWSAAGLGRSGPSWVRTCLPGVEEHQSPPICHACRPEDDTAPGLHAVGKSGAWRFCMFTSLCRVSVVPHWFGNSIVGYFTLGLR